METGQTKRRHCPAYMAYNKDRKLEGTANIQLHQYINRTKLAGKHVAIRIKRVFASQSHSRAGSNLYGFTLYVTLPREPEEFYGI